MLGLVSRTIFRASAPLRMSRVQNVVVNEALDISHLTHISHAPPVSVIPQAISRMTEPISGVYDFYTAACSVFLQ